MRITALQMNCGSVKADNIAQATHLIDSAMAATTDADRLTFAWELGAAAHGAVLANYVEATVHCSCGNSFETRSTKAELNVEICSQCHPFYTGKQKILDTAGRIERFKNRYAGAPKAEEK